MQPPAAVHPAPEVLESILRLLLFQGTSQEVLVFIELLPEELRPQTVRNSIGEVEGPDMANLREVFGLYPDLLQDPELAINLFWAEDFDRLETLYGWGWRPTEEIQEAWRERLRQNELEAEEMEGSRSSTRRVQDWLAAHS